MKNNLESAVIVKNSYGATATLRFSNARTDRIISANSKQTLYKLVEKYVAEVTL